MKEISRIAALEQIKYAQDLFDQAEAALTNFLDDKCEGKTKEELLERQKDARQEFDRLIRTENISAEILYDGLANYISFGKFLESMLHDGKLPSISFSLNKLVFDLIKESVKDELQQKQPVNETKEKEAKFEENIEHRSWEELIITSCPHHNNSKTF